MAEQVVDVLEAVEANDQKRHFGAGSFGGRNHRSQPGLKRIAVGEAGERVVFGEVADLLGFAFAHRDVAQDRSILKSVRALPARETGFDREYFTIAAPGIEFDHLAGAKLALIADREWGVRFRARRADRVEWPADHFVRAIAEDGRRAGIPYRNDVI